MFVDNFQYALVSWSQSYLSRTNRYKMSDLALIKLEILFAHECNKQTIHDLGRVFYSILTSGQIYSTSSALYRFRKNIWLAFKVNTLVILSCLSLIGRQYVTARLIASLVPKHLPVEISRASTNGSPLESAKISCGGKLGVNQAIVIKGPKNTELNTDHLIYVCAPIKGLADLDACYQTIFETVECAGIIGKIAIPSFSTRVGEGYEPELAANCALTAANNFLRRGSFHRIQFVTCPRDKRNQQAYKKALDNQGDLFKQFVRHVTGTIQDCEVNAIIVPVGVDFSNPGQVSEAVEKAARNIKKVYTNIPKDTILQQIPAEVLSRIFRYVDIKALGALCRVSTQTYSLINADDAVELWRRFVPKNVKLDNSNTTAVKQWLKVHSDVKLDWVSIAHPKGDNCGKIKFALDCWKPDAMPAVMSYIAGRSTCIKYIGMGCTLYWYKGEDHIIKRGMSTSGSLSYGDEQFLAHKEHPDNRHYEIEETLSEIGE